MGTGVGEAMLISAATGAAVGGASAAITGGDPLKGALLGGVTGGAGAGIGGALGGAAAGTASGAAGGTAAGAGTGAATGALGGTAAGAGAGGMFSGLGGLGTSAAGAMGAGAGGTFSGLGGLGTSAAGAMGGAGAAGAGGSGMLAGMGGANPFAGAQLPSAGVSGGALSAAPVATVPEVGLMDIFSPGEGLGNMPMSERVGNYLVQNPMSTGMTAGSVGAMMAGSGGDDTPDDEDDEEYDGPLRKFRYSPSTYRPAFASGGGIAEIPLRGKLGTFSDGGQMVEGPGDGMSDDIPAVIGEAQPARLTDGEFVVPADVVSGLGNGSTDAGARALYEMMDRVRKARTGSTEQAAEINPQEVMGFADGGSVAAPAARAPAYSIPYRTAASVDKQSEYGLGALSGYGMGSSGNALLSDGWMADGGGYWSPDGKQVILDGYDYRTGEWVGQPDMRYDPAPVQAYIDQRIDSVQQQLQQQQSQQQQPQQQQSQQQRGQLAQLPGYAAQRDYTSMARPGYQEFGPSGQFYQPIYQPEYEDMSMSKQKYSPGYDVTPAVSDADYYNQKLAQLRRTGPTYDGIDWSQANAGDLRNYFESLGLTPQQHWEQWGREEGIHRPFLPFGFNTNRG